MGDYSQQGEMFLDELTHTYPGNICPGARVIKLRHRYICSECLTGLPEHKEGEQMSLGLNVPIVGQLTLPIG